MTVTTRFDAIARLLAMLFATALVLAALPLGIAAAQEDDEEINGEVVNNGPEPGDPDDEDDDGMVASTRFHGEQRFATAALIAADTWEQSDRAVIARHDEWPDALAGGYLAGLFEAPVLLISQNNIQDDTLAALEQLDVSEITLLGGSAAISAENEQDLEDMGYEVDRISGETRFETAAQIAGQGEPGEHDEMATAFVATGINFADALTAGPIAYDGNFPILLTPSQSLHEATEQALEDQEIEQVILLGGQNAISSDVESEIRDVLGVDEDSDAVQRLFGTTRIETAADVAGFAIDERGFAPFQHGWARGNEFADALTIGPRLGDVGGPLLLVPTPTLADSGDDTNQEFASDVSCFTAMIDVAGGTAAISEAVEDTLRGWLACPDQPMFLSLGAEPESTEMDEWIDLTATVQSNTGEAIAETEVTFDAVEVTPPAATVEFREEDGEPEDEGPITVETDEDGLATVQVSSDAPSVVEIEATHERDDEFALSDTVEVSFTPPDGGFTTFPDVPLSSEQEVGDGTAEDADPPFEGTANLLFQEDVGLVCWDLELDEPAEDQETGSFEAWAADAGIPGSHIHEEEPGENGPIRVVLGTLDDETLTSRGCSVTEFDLQEIVDNEEQFYVNLHTDLYPVGIARGQLSGTP